MQRTVELIDTHTGGEPTRVVMRGGPDLGNGNMADRAKILAGRADWLRKSLILEPRGSDWMVGAILQQPCDPGCAAGVIFFNNVGYLGMCGHGLMGVVEALAHQQSILPGEHAFETPVGVVSATLYENRMVSITNVESYQWKSNLALQVPDEGIITGDIAYGGNWFFLTAVPQIDASEIDALTARCRRIRAALQTHNIRGADGAEIDHIELFAPASDPSKANSQNFVLCPGGQYDRSPCGTGTSAKVACLAADGVLQPGEVWKQESIIGSVFEACYSKSANGVTPVITGRAFVTGQTAMLFDEADPFRHGIEIGSHE